MNLSANLIRKLEALDPKMKDVFLCFMEEVDEKTKIIAVGRSDFDELKDVVHQLARGPEAYRASGRGAYRGATGAYRSAEENRNICTSFGCGLERFAPDVEAYAAKR